MWNNKYQCWSTKTSMDQQKPVWINVFADNEYGETLLFDNGGITTVCRLFKLVLRIQIQTRIRLELWCRPEPNSFVSAVFFKVKFVVFLRSWIVGDDPELFIQNKDNLLEQNFSLNNSQFCIAKIPVLNHWLITFVLSIHTNVRGIERRLWLETTNPPSIPDPDPQQLKGLSSEI